MYRTCIYISRSYSERNKNYLRKTINAVERFYLVYSSVYRTTRANLPKSTVHTVVDFTISFYRCTDYSLHVKQQWWNAQIWNSSKLKEHCCISCGSKNSSFSSRLLTAHLILYWKQEACCRITTLKPRVRLLCLCAFDSVIFWKRQYPLNILLLNAPTSLSPSSSQIRCNIRENSVDVPLIHNRITKLLVSDTFDHACCFFLFKRC